jgi:hypothetical protein
MASIKKAQESLGPDFTAGGIGKEENIKLTGFESVMSQAALAFIKLAKKRLTQRGKIDTGNLSDIVVTQLTNKGGSYSITIGYDKNNPASKYYDFNDKGVKGIGGFKGVLPRGFKEPTNSRYSFKNLRLSKSFIESITRWYVRHKQYIRNDDQKKNLSGLQRKRKKLGTVVSETEKIRGLAIATARNIKRKGISRTGFFVDNIEEAFGQEFQIKLAKALGQDVVINIKQTLK